MGIGQRDLGAAQIAAASRQFGQLFVTQQQRLQPHGRRHLVGAALLDVLRAHVQQGRERRIAEQETALGVSNEDQVLVGVDHAAEKDLLVVQGVAIALQFADVARDGQMIAQPGGHQTDLEGALGLQLAPGLLAQRSFVGLIE